MGNLIRRITEATPKKELNSWREGVVYDVFVQKMTTGCYCIYKGARHFKEASGYKVFKTLDEIEDNFYLKSELVTSNA